jgi:tmRNA-binding protein
MYFIIKKEHPAIMTTSMIDFTNVSRFNCNPTFSRKPLPHIRKLRKIINIEPIEEYSQSPKKEYEKSTYIKIRSVNKSGFLSLRIIGVMC